MRLNLQDTITEALHHKTQRHTIIKSLITPTTMFHPEALLTGLAVLVMTFHLSNLFNPKAFRKALKDFVADSNAVRIGGVMLLFVSFFFLTTHWKFEGKWISIVAILGWMIFLKGLTWIWSPKSVKKYVTTMLLKNENKSTMLSTIAILVALFLLYAAAQITRVPSIGLSF